MPVHPPADVRLIVADLDGTLLNSAHEVMPLTQNALDEAIARGLLFTVATGKTFPSTTALIRRYGIRTPVICSNGTLVHAPDGTILHRDPIPLDLALEAIRMAEAVGVSSVIYSGAGLVAERADANTTVLVAHHEPVPVIAPNLFDALRTSYPPDKIIFIQENDLEAVAQLQLDLERAFAGRAQIIRSGLASVVEILPIGVSKGTALAFLLDYLDIPPEQVIAFGDNCNDLDMLRRAGIGVAMGHAPDDVRRAADYVTGTNDEDGVGMALYRLVLTPQAGRNKTGR